MFFDGCVSGDGFKSHPVKKDDDCRTVSSLRPVLRFGYCGACGTKLGPDKRPQLLPCLHSLCSQCVPHALGVDDRASQRCLVCGVEYSPTGVTDDFFYKDSQSGPSKPISKCGGCGGAGAGGWCVECGEALCPECVSAHKRVKVTREHTVLPQKPPTECAPTVHCSTHDGDAASLLCRSCDELICRTCGQTSHSGHSLVVLKKAVINERTSIKPLADHVRVQRKKVREGLSDLDRRLLDLNDSQTKLNGDLRAAVLRIRDALWTRAVALTDEMKEVCDSERKSVLERQEALKKLEERQTYLLSFTERALETEGYSALLSCRRKIRRQLQDVASRDISPNPPMVAATFCCDGMVYSKIQTFGEVVVKTVPFACTGKLPQPPHKIQNPKSQGVLPAQPLSTPSPKLSADSSSCRMPPTISQVPPIFSQILPTSSQILPAYSRIPPTFFHILPTSSHVLPTSSPVPPTSCHIPPAIFNIPPTSCHIPPTFFHVPPMSSQTPPTSSQIPPTSSLIPLTFLHVPPTSSQTPSTFSQIPPTSSQTPPTFSQISPTFFHVPPTSPHIPPTLFHVPPTSSQIPPTSSQTPPTSSLIPPTLFHVPPTSSQIPPTSSQTSPTSSHIPPTFVHVPPTSSQTPPTLCSEAQICPPALCSNPHVQSTLSSTLSQPHSVSPLSPHIRSLILFVNESPRPPCRPKYIGPPHRNKPCLPSAPPLPAASTIPSSQSEPCSTHFHPDPPAANASAPVSSPGLGGLNPRALVRFFDSVGSKLQSAHPIGCKDESDLLGRPMEENDSQMTGDADVGSVQEPRKVDQRPLVPRVSLVRLPISFPPPGCPLPQFRLIPQANKQEVHLEQIPEEDQSAVGAAVLLSHPPRPPQARKVRCAVCREAGELSQCADCGSSFHADCHLTPVTDSDSWQCMVCEDLWEVKVHQSRVSEQDSALGLPDQSKCKRLFLTLISQKHSALLYRQPELLSPSSRYVDITLIRDRLLQKLSPAYLPSEFVSDVWLLLNSLQKSPEDIKPVAKLQRTFQKRLRKAFGSSLHPSLLESPPGKKVEAFEGGAEAQGAEEARQTMKRKRKEESVKEELSEPSMKKLCKDEEREGGME
ncbi:transcription intermediary factor 1-beta-like isoform X3 [Anguilla rostrata]|uniref:transcription intermediary factor 1-beta-like isoform X3 n=1 Tax=Anguilla rostrata TaxID=7938 RepID=UPI0030D000D3